MNNRSPLLPPIPPNMPQVKPNRFIRWVARCTLRLGGWKVTGTLPDVPKVVFIIAPHSSNWDGFWGMAAKIALGMQVKVLGKASLFWWPLAPLLRTLGVIPLDRSSPQGTVEQAVSLIRGADRMWYAITPEGTRKAVQHWKAGFLKIARMADVPVLAAYFHYPERPSASARCSIHRRRRGRHGRDPRVLPPVAGQDPRHRVRRGAGASSRPRTAMRHDRHMPPGGFGSRVTGCGISRSAPSSKEPVSCRVP